MTYESLMKFFNKERSSDRYATVNQEAQRPLLLARKRRSIGS
jgi:hypothetical protein